MSNEKSDDKELPRIVTRGEPVYNIDDIDGQFYMLDRRFSGCLILRFSKNMDETVYGSVTCGGVELPRGLIKRLPEAMNMQFFGIPVRDVFLEYDKEYSLTFKNFKDTDGLIMKSQDITVKTMPKTKSDPAYAGHDEVALQAAREGIVLLKNENNILPLSGNSTLKLVKVHEFRIGAVGAGRINPRYSINLLRGIEECSRFRQDENADICVFVISRGTGENLDANPIQGEFYLTADEEKTIAEISEKYAKTIAIINSGYPMDVRWIDKYGIDAAIWCGFPGMLGGKALVEILDGRVNPSGKLPDTWSLDYFDIPASANFYTVSRERPPISTDTPAFVDTYYEEDMYVGYRYFETFNKPVAYPFGFGLSYTGFLITAELQGTLENPRIIAQVKNTGSVSGKETVQIYAQISEGKLEQPSKRLVGFSKTKSLDFGKIEELEINIEKNTLASFDTETASWILEKGSYVFYVGNSIKTAAQCGEFVLNEDMVIRKVENLMQPPVKIDTFSKKNSGFPKGLHSGVKKDVNSLEPKSVRRHYPEPKFEGDDLASTLSVDELARLSVCASHGWGMHEKGEAGRIFRLEKHDIPKFTVADGNNGVNVHKPNIGMPCSNTLCATFNRDLVWQVGRVIAEEAKENDIQMILAPAMNLHRNPLNGRHPEYFSEDPYLTGIIAGHQSKGLEENGVSSCVKHAAANNCETARKRNHSIVSERALRELYLKVFEVSLSVHQCDGMMTGYNALNGVFTAEDEELIQGIFRKEFGFNGFVMTDWSSYDTTDVAASIQAGNCWMTPGTTDDTYVTPIVQGVREGRIDEERLRSNVRHILRVIQRRTEKDFNH
ncbi:hypothetical protein FACS189479_02230 [Spirochaetia bacterium]|nr:hypothetical protein FACS189479_02230 [Spirochaetia bacterium]